jgi:site-specific DNA recombinase
MAFAHLEREQTSERTREATLARAERGLWNGGYVIGYDLDPDKKGNLVPNEKERVIVSFAFNTCLKCGSAFEARKIMDRHGFRTKEYTSRRGKFHPGQRFSYSSVQQMLTNYVYIGKKEVNKRNKAKNQKKLPESQRYKIVDAKWEPIIDEDTFFKVQALLKKNHASKHNVAKPVKHNYLLNSGLLWCEKCGTEMEGTCGTGKMQVKYYYYKCKNKRCKFKVPANEVERVVVERIRQLATDEHIMAGIVEATNKKLQKELPQLREQKALLERELEDVKDSADGIMNGWKALASGDSEVFLKEKLDSLGKRRKEIEEGIQALEVMIEEIERESVSEELVIRALSKFTKVFANIRPHEQKELLRMVLHKAILGPDSMKMALYGRPPDIEPSSPHHGDSRSQIPSWLPSLDDVRTFCVVGEGMASV